MPSPSLLQLQLVPEPDPFAHQQLDVLSSSCTRNHPRPRKGGCIDPRKAMRNNIVFTC